jgi:hypothetical protein
VSRAYAPRQEAELNVLAEGGFGEPRAPGREGLDDLLDAHPLGVRLLDRLELVVGPGPGLRFPISPLLSPR